VYKLNVLERKYHVDPIDSSKICKFKSFEIDLHLETHENAIKNS